MMVPAKIIEKQYGRRNISCYDSLVILSFFVPVAVLLTFSWEFCILILVFFGNGPHFTIGRR